MNTNFPTIYIYGESTQGHPDDCKVRIAYGKERKETEKEPDWTCKICNINNFATRLRCFRCQTLRPDPATTGKASNVGDNDVAPDNMPSQFILLRGLEGSVSEELLVKGVSKLNKPSGNPSTPAPKKGKVASTTGDSNLGAKDGSLRRILLVRDRATNDSWKFGFAEYASIEDAQSALIRYTSFDRFTIASKQVLASYIHAGVFVPEQNPSAATERFNFSPIGNPSIKLKYWDEDAYVTELIVNIPVEEKTIPRTINPAEKEGIKSMPDLDKLKKRKQQLEANSSSKKATPSHLQFWSNRHAELHGLNKGEAKSKDTAIPSKSYADQNRYCCYLCMRQFNDAAEVNRHERLSDLHLNNLKDETKVQRAERKLKKHCTITTDEDKSDYRDRARERRKIYGVVNKQGEQVQPAKARSPSPPAQASKGASLMAKMGYNSGSGLGMTGDGMTAPIAQHVYAAGVGLGAQGGKLGDAVEQAEKNTKSDYGEWVNQGRDKFYERYKNL